MKEEKRLSEEDKYSINIVLKCHVAVLSCV